MTGSGPAWAVDCATGRRGRAVWVESSQSLCPLWVSLDPDLFLVSPSPSLPSVHPWVYELPGWNLAGQESTLDPFRGGRR